MRLITHACLRSIRVNKTANDDAALLDSVYSNRTGGARAAELYLTLHTKILTHPARLHTISVMLDLVQPPFARRRHLAQRRATRFYEAGKGRSLRTLKRAGNEASGRAMRGSARLQRSTKSRSVNLADRWLIMRTLLPFLRPCRNRQSCADAAPEPHRVRVIGPRSVLNSSLGDQRKRRVHRSRQLRTILHSGTSTTRP